MALPLICIMNRAALNLNKKSKELRRHIHNLIHKTFGYWRQLLTSKTGLQNQEFQREKNYPGCSSA
jgi:hypothetical protein